MFIGNDHNVNLFLLLHSNFLESVIENKNLMQQLKIRKDEEGKLSSKLSKDPDYQR